MNETENKYFVQFGEEMSDVGIELERIDTLAKDVGQTLSSGFRGAILDGKSFKSVLGDISKSFANIALKAAFKPLGTLVSGVVDQLFQAVNPALVTPFAKGGVLSAPTYFPMQNGLGLAGEARAEAILPLARGSDGRLGVAAGGAAPMSISVNIQTSDVRSFVGAEAEVSAMLLRAVKRGTRAS